MSDGKRSKKYSSNKESKRPIILSKRDDIGAEQPQSSDIQPKILLKSKEKPTAQAPVQAISIASREGSVNSRIASPIPKNVNVAANKDCKDLAAPVIIEQPQIQVPVMKMPLPIITDHYQLNNQVFDYLVETNTNFFVVGIIGTQGVGKSTFMNLLASFDRLDSGAEIFTNNDLNAKAERIFPIRTNKETIFSAAPTTEGIQMYVTKDRIILLDCSPILCNPYKKDHVLSEMDDLKMIMFLMSVCHLLIVIQDSQFNSNLIRLISCAEMMKPNFDIEQQDEYFPNILFLHNMAECHEFSIDSREHVDRLYRCAFKGSKLKILPGNNSTNDDDVWEGKHCSKKTQINYFRFPNLQRKESYVYSGHPDINILIAEFRQRVFMSPRHQFQTLPVGLFSEKNWSHLATNVWEAHKNSYFLGKYSNFKEKEWAGRIPT